MKNVFAYSAIGIVFFILSLAGIDTVVDQTIMVSFTGSIFFAISMIFFGFAINSSLKTPKIRDYFVWDIENEDI